MRQTSNIITELAEIKREIELLKSAQIFGGDNTVVYSDSDSFSDGSGSYTSSVIALFKGINTGVELSSSFEFKLDSTLFYSNTNEIFMTQIETDKDLAKYENSYLVAFQKVDAEFDAFIATGKITTRTPITVTAEYDLQNF